MLVIRRKAHGGGGDAAVVEHWEERQRGCVHQTRGSGTTCQGGRMICHAALAGDDTSGGVGGGGDVGHQGGGA